ncbi:hypothetical protein SEA_YEEZY_75 [Gordonia phage Yeezy]|uniref:Uncharacterized protein n=1 Tax=Gordonia phage Yeezy TaxID=1821565 RepID=A0A142K9N7_9CAUD|nr:hypothetical protein SEA_YEEZY_75 [Gordonia phage Yeezy]AMS02820.1 hypothetical protein SEA_YEEZY_75 [Gordonia phage Yeezy]
MTDHHDLLDRIDAVIRDAEIDELVDWQLARGGGSPMERLQWKTETTWSSVLALTLGRLSRETSFGAWLVDQVHEADQLVQRLRQRGRL